MTKKVALIKGDGCGPELVDAMLKVMKAVDTNVNLVECEAGLEWWENHGGNSYIPQETWQILEAADACFKGPTTTISHPDTPRSVAISIRQRFDLYANIRPIQTFRGVVGPLGMVDFICVREATEGLYCGIEHRFGDDLAIAFRIISRRASERVARKAFEVACGKGWNSVATVSKANILRQTDGLFLEAVKKIAHDYPDIGVSDYYVDNFAQQLMKNPQQFNQNVILSTNLFMDIISEEASVLVGGIGCAYSGNFGDRYAMFEPAHGSSPKDKNQDRQNPTATILSGAWMLEYLGETDQAIAVFEATRQVIAEGKTLTYDLGGDAKTSEMTAAIVEKVKSIS
jgi:isocitrate dehydrogenase (NAD+)